MTVPEASAPRKRPEFFNLPNVITLVRVVLTPVFLWLLLDGRLWAAFAVLVVAGTTDVLDGFFARLLHLKTRTGLWFDPAADKLLLTTAFISLTLPAIAGRFALPLWLTAIVIGRDILIGLGSGTIILLRGPRPFYPTTFGKISTVCQVFAVWGGLLAACLKVSHPALDALYIITAASTLVSGVHYALIGVRMLRQPEPARGGPAAGATGSGR
jgi:cardiolipin synthase (CMP-forming)